MPKKNGERTIRMNNILNQPTRLPGLTKTKGLILASLIAGAMALPFLMPVQKAQADNKDSERSGNSDALVGTWLVQVSLDPASLPPGSTLNFTRLDTYCPGGVLLESNNGPGAGGPAGQGNWVAIGRHQFAATELRLGFDAANIFTGISKIRSSLIVNRGGDEFTATVQTDIILPNGITLPFHPAGTSHGTRVAIEPLN
jgi:hypothetical protein